MKKLLFITGTRADFGKLKGLMRVVEESLDFELHVLVTGMHMMPLYGSTHIEVAREDYKNSYFIANQFINEPMSSIIANTLGITSRLIDTINPDMVVIHGDRIEALAGAIAGALSHIKVCHIEGGEVSGTIDDSVRHAISKLAHIHLVANDEAKDRLIQLGEELNSIYIIGSPDLDVMSSKNLPSIEDVKKYYDIIFDNYGLVLFHPVTSEYKEIKQYAKNLFQALEKSKKNYIVIYPNNDTGSIDILDIINFYRNKEQFQVFPSIRFESFLVLLKYSKFLIGNSSAGIREAPFYGIPSINIGTRQNLRFKGNSIIHCDYQEDNILKAISQAQDIDPEPSKWFGTGESVNIFKKLINKPEIWNVSVQKVFVDIG